MMLSVTAVLTGFISWWLTKRFCDPTSHLYLLDHPNQRSLHQVPTPRTGGIALLTSAACGLGLTLLMVQGEERTEGSLPNSTVVWIIGMTVVLAAVSFCDDRWSLPIGLRFGVQLIASLVLVAGAGLVFQSVWVPGVGSLQLGWTAGPLTVVFLVWMANLYNFMDGMDGFAGGMTLVGFGFLAYFAWSASHHVVFVLSLMVAAAAAGFLASNFPPARIFMGDVGSVPLGFLAGSLAVYGQLEGLFEVWVPIIVFSPFIVDATVTLVRRVLRFEKVWQAHRAHYYQRLVLSGWGHRKTVLMEYLLMIACGVLAVLYHLGYEGPRAAVLAVWVAAYGALAAMVRLVERKAVR